MLRNDTTRFKDADNVTDLRGRFEHAFEEAYLAALRKSDFEVISEMLARTISLVQRLPIEQRLKLAEKMRDAVDQMTQRYADIFD